ncbi:MAG: fumarate hydratase, partial [Desulfobacca sp.]|nr:fumarate hydratase [Desulfobacca sp.]
MPEFLYQPMFLLGADTTEYRLLTTDFVEPVQLDGYQLLTVSPEGLTFLAETAFKDVSHLYRSSHLTQLKKILEDPDSSDNDRYVALEMLKNAVIAADGIFPMCQDTGTAIIIGKKGENVRTGGGDEAALSKG